MCGRVAQAVSIETLKKIYDAKSYIAELEANYNLAPRQQAAIIRTNLDTGERSINNLQWGLVPGWAEADHKFSTFNAKAEELAHKRFYQHAWTHAKRCILPVTAFL